MSRHARALEILSTLHALARADSIEQTLAYLSAHLVAEGAYPNRIAASEALRARFVAAADHAHPVTRLALACADLERSE